jgi:GNAT superfamily N-acetyltransferase
MRIIEIADQQDEQAIGDFLKVAAEVYQNDHVWVAASDNIFLQRFKAAQSNANIKFWPFVALDNNLPVARGAAILASNAKDVQGNLEGWLGFFESNQRHPQAGKAILEKCEQRLAAAGAISVVGPKIDNLILGLLVNGFSLPQTIFTNHNPPYYLELFKQCGFGVKTRILTYTFDRNTVRLPEIKKMGFLTRTFNRFDFSKETLVFHQLQNSIFYGSVGWVPRTFDEDRELIESFLSFIDDELVIIAEDSKGNHVGLLVCLPDIYQPFREGLMTRARIISIGVLPGWERNGVGAMMVSHLITNLLKKGYSSIEASWILDSNKLSQNLARRFNAVSGREFALLEKRLC